MAVRQSLIIDLIPTDLAEVLSSRSACLIARILHPSSLQYNLITNVLLPWYLQYPRQTFGLEHVQFLYISFRHLPSLGAVH